MEQESGIEPVITGQDVKAKIQKLKAMKAILDQQKTDLFIERIDQEGISDELDFLAEETEINLADTQRSISAEEWIELWQRVNALEVILTDMENSIANQDENYQRAVKAANISDQAPGEYRGNILN